MFRFDVVSHHIRPQDSLQGCQKQELTFQMAWKRPFFVHFRFERQRRRHVVTCGRQQPKDVSRDAKLVEERGIKGQCRLKQ